MKLLRISSIPDKYLKDNSFNQNRQEYHNYDTQLSWFFKHFIAISDVMTYELNQIGTYQAAELVVNYESLQKRWASEQNINYGDNWKTDILTAQIQYYNPDVILVNTNEVGIDLLNRISKNTNVKLKIIWDGFQYSNPKKNIGFDMVLTCIDSIKKKYDAINIDCHVLPFAFDKRVLDHVSVQKNQQLNFIGTLGEGHKIRRAALVYLLKNRVDLKLYIDNIAVGNKLLSRSMLREVIQRKDLKGFFEVAFLQKYNLGVKFGLDMYKQMSAAYTTLNFHGDNVFEAGNMRLFEATGLGTCLLTDKKQNLESFFEPDSEVLVFSSQSELLEKVKYLEGNPDKAIEIGLNARKRVFEQHLWEQRIQDLDRIIHSRI